MYRVRRHSRIEAFEPRWCTWYWRGPAPAVNIFSSTSLATAIWLMLEGSMIAIGATASASVGAAVRWRIFSGSHSAKRDNNQQNTK